MVALATAAAAEGDVADFYRGKSISVNVGTTAGGGYDLDARVISRHLGRFIPGEPTLVVQNAPGARGLSNVNRTYASGRRDGTVVTIVQRGLLTAPWLAPQGIQYDVFKFNWLFSTAAEAGVAIVWHESPNFNAKDILQKEIVVGGAGDSTIIPQVLNFTIGTKFKMVSGYPGTADLVLAMQRREIEGIGYYSWSNIAAKNPDWIRDKKIRVLLQTGTKRLPDLPDVPTVTELVTSPAMRQVQDLWLAPIDTARPYAMPPEVPMERVEAVRKAFFEMVKDAQFIEDARKSGMTVDPRTAQDIMAMLERFRQTPTDVIEQARKAVDPKDL
jgi:tripartite-type tricarboxylate transporter receptor subunit TctC